jgi:osmotically-inducible protein OsmY
MKTSFATFCICTMTILMCRANAQVQSNTPADRAVAQNVSQALVKAGIDPRTTSVRVVTTADHTIYLSGLISNAQTVRLAASAAAKAAPSYRVVNNIHSSFFDDQSHVTGDKTK